MRTAAPFALLLLAGCGPSVWSRAEPPPVVEKAERLKREGRTGEALVLLQKAPLAPSLFPFCGFGPFSPIQQILRLKWELLRRPLELAPALIELEPEPKKNPPPALPGMFRGKKMW